MGKKRPTSNKSNLVQKSKKKTFVIAGVVAFLILGLVVIKAISGGGANTAAASEDIKIAKSDISETAKFYSYKAGKTNMEVLAVKADDGTIRTAFNTCQVCFASGRGYYVQEGDQLVCQNCGNRFRLDQVEKIKGGCNPVPIMEDNKTDDGTNIVISKDFLENNKDLFANWRRSS